ncbi:MAG TPA: hypothetical protein VK137_17470 [Planctomycetaceae bacterium]|nr:hypothetical protein [Planctomycetaceae bacterium]
MSTTTATNEQLRLGFLTAIHLPDRGHVAGLLVTNRFGRPLEFQCTAPVRPNRTQELLYGPTLVPFLLGELLSKTLLDRIGVKPHVVLTDRAEILDARPHVSQPVAGVVESARGGRGSSAEQTLGEMLRIGKQQFRLHAEFREDLKALEKVAKELAADADLLEPLDRVREALQETMKSAA